MTLSTSHFNSRLPRLTLLLLAAGLLAWIGSAAYTLKVNPDVRDFTAGANIKVAWLEDLRTRFPSNYIVFGGSSSSFSVDPQYALDELNFPLSNLALGAGMGLQVLTRFAVEHARPGDTLVMTMEPGLLVGSLAVPQLGQQFSIGIGHPELAAEGTSIGLDDSFAFTTYISALRPGGSHFVTLVGKILGRRPLYRYKIGEFERSGQKRTEIRLPLATPRNQLKVSDRAKEFLISLRDWADSNGVQVVYSLPWGYCTPAELDEFRRENLAFLEQLVAYIPILREPRLGAYEKAEHFADTPWHLNEEGAKIRTRELVQALRQEPCRSREELNGLLSQAENQDP